MNMEENLSQFEKESEKMEKINKNEMKKTEALFKIRPTNEEGNNFIITVGTHLATEMHFETKEEAKAFITKPR